MLLDAVYQMEWVTPRRQNRRGESDSGNACHQNNNVFTPRPVSLLPSSIPHPPLALPDEEEEPCNSSQARPSGPTQEMHINVLVVCPAPAHFAIHVSS